MMKTINIKTCDHRTISLLIDISKENIDVSVNSVVSVMEEIMIAELYRIRLLQDGRTFCNIKIQTYLDGIMNTYNYQFPMGRIEMVINEVWKIDATLRLEVERDFLKMII